MRRFSVGDERGADLLSTRKRSLQGSVFQERFPLYVAAVVSTTHMLTRRP